MHVFFKFYVEKPKEKKKRLILVLTTIVKITLEHLTHSEDAENG